MRLMQIIHDNDKELWFSDLAFRNVRQNWTTNQGQSSFAVNRL